MNAKRSIGLTGGISTGKSTVSDYIANKYQIPVLDADLYAREAVNPGSSILDNLVKRYGKKILLADRSLNRQALGAIIFNDASEKKWLEQQIHPFVRDRFIEEMQKLNDEIVILAIPLLFEANLVDLVNEIWVVYCGKNQQIERLSKRDRLNQQQARIRIDSQLPIEQKIAAADVILDNSSSLEALYQQIDRAIASISSL
jgi:dephospho-CoA kinase